MGSRRRITVALVGLVALVLAGWLIQRGSGADPLPVQGLSTLPVEAAATWHLIERGGPFPYPGNDGVPFANREGHLPAQRSDYYREYTVPTPGSHDRGARRLVTGSGHELYYTGDHYVTFVAVDPSR